MAIDTIQTEINRINTGKETLRCAINNANAAKGIYIEAGSFIDSADFLSNTQSVANKIFTTTETYNYFGGELCQNTSSATPSYYFYDVTLPSITLHMNTENKTFYWVYQAKVNGYNDSDGFYFGGRRMEYDRPYFLARPTLTYRTSGTADTEHAYVELFGIVRKQYNSSTGNKATDILYIGTFSTSKLHFLNVNQTETILSYMMDTFGCIFSKPIIAVGGLVKAAATGTYSARNNWKIVGTTTLDRTSGGITSVSDESDQVDLPSSVTSNQAYRLVGFNKIMTQFANGATSGTCSLTNSLQTQLFLRAKRILIGDPTNGYYEYYTQASAVEGWFAEITGNTKNSLINYPLLDTGTGIVDNYVNNYICVDNDNTSIVVKDIQTNTKKGDLLKLDGTQVTTTTSINDGDVFYLSTFGAVQIN